jgi:hypothetical protein
MAEQPGGKFIPAVSKAGRGDVEIQRREDPSKVRFNTRFDPQSFQSRPPSQQSFRLQEEPLRRAGRVASTGGMNPSFSDILETGSR